MTTPKVSAIVTVAPYAPFIDAVAAHPLVEGLRLNTVMPIKAPHTDIVAKLAAFGKPLWVDLKGRQLRVVGAAIPPFTEVRVSHRVKVKTPCDAFFDDGREDARVVEVDGDRLILEDGPRRFIGPGESINIVDPSLEIEGTLTDTDRAYLAAMKELGERRVMLSYVEKKEDVDEVKALLPNAEVVLKIETERGLALAEREGAKLGRLMAARGDLYVEVLRPHRIASAVKRVLRADPRAIVASRLFPSLADGPVPAASDIGDAAFLLEIGYRSFLFGDDVCMKKESALASLNLLDALASEMT